MGAYELAPRGPQLLIMVKEIKAHTELCTLARQVQVRYYTCQPLVIICTLGMYIYSAAGHIIYSLHRVKEND